MAYDVFISYAVEDKAIADAVCQALEESSVRCWYAPRDVPYAVDYEEAIVDAISESKLMVLILSAHSNNSAHVKREVQNAYREEPQVSVLPFQVENISLNKALRYYIGSVQWLNAITPPLETHLQKLVNYVQSRLPQREQEKDQPAEPEVRAEAKEDERRRANESSPMPDVADAVGQRSAEPPILKRARWLLEGKPILVLVFTLPILAALIWVLVFDRSKLRLVNLNPTPTSTPPTVQKMDTSLTAAENAKRGKDLFGQGKYAEAQVFYREALRLQPNNAPYQNSLGDALARQEKYAEAESLYREAARLKPNEEVYQFKLGWALQNQKEYAKAEQAYREAMRLNPLDGAIRSYLGDVLSLQSRFAEAETQYGEAVRISPTNPVFHYNLGNALFAQRKNAEARIQYQKAVQLDPRNLSFQEALRRVQE